MGRVFPAATAMVLALAATTAQADSALVIGASEAARHGWWSGNGPDSAQILRNAGFEVITADARSVSEMREALSRFLEGIDGEERVVVHLAGEFFHDAASRHWLIEAGSSARPDLATIDDIGLSLETVLAVAGRVPGGAVVALGMGEGKAAAGAGLETGVVEMAVPQGVTLLKGEAQAVADFVAGPLLVPGQSLPQALEDAKKLSGAGFLSPRLAFLPEGEPRPVAPPNAAEVERAIWQATLAQDSAPGYESYLERYPDGFFATEARAALDKIRTEPNRIARLSEEALALTRERRQQVQRELTLLGFDPRGVDGMFGPGSRAAITRFQTANGFPATGFLDATQIERLSLQAERRSAEQAADERRRELDQEKRDREAWAAVAETGDEAGLRTYLDRYPNGLYAPIARQRLDVLQADARAQAEALENADWERAAANGTPEALRAYLEAHPDGAHAQAARERLGATRNAEIASVESAAIEAARAEENSLGLNAVTRMLIEQRLAQLQINPGAVDGNFDDNSRAAIRRYQQDRQISPTGYVNQAVISKLLSDVGLALPR